MSALIARIDALDAAVKAATPGPWTPATWCNDDGEWVARGPLRVNRPPVQMVGEADDDYADRCLDHDSSEPGCDGDQQAHADADLMCAAVNAAPVLSAIARAAAEYRETIRKLEAADDRQAIFLRMDAVRMANALFAALDRAKAEAAR